jgi:uncharacterized protein (TIGR02466 family)
MTESKIVGIFPTPIYLSKINRELTSKELSFIDKVKSDSHTNEGNLTSNDNYILNNKIFKDLKEQLNLKLKDYFDKIICPANNVAPYITQSWLNYTEKNQFHHRHQHYNSLISGVFYINCNEQFDKIKFFSDKYEFIKFKLKEYNMYNTSGWVFPVKTGDIILFPSNLNHMVDIKEGNNLRISLAFNTFIKGEIGEDNNLDRLFL